jgi:hypothetical protein
MIENVQVQPLTLRKYVLKAELELGGERKQQWKRKRKEKLFIIIFPPPSFLRPS